MTSVSPVVLLHPTRLSRELQEKEKVIEVLQAKLDAQSLTPSSSQALSDSHRSPSSSSFLSDELEACSDMDVASEYTQYEEKKPAPGHSGSLHFLLPALCGLRGDHHAQALEVCLGGPRAGCGSGTKCQARAPVGQDLCPAPGCPPAYHTVRPKASCSGGRGGHGRLFLPAAA